ncbi:MAG: ABC transporter substrate-binding protein [Acidobacteria bacterium]|nr:ABC transporter substrate-binding protein [Acidobacteriota bacterium]
MRRPLLVLFALLFVLAACGQKAGVRDTQQVGASDGIGSSSETTAPAVDGEATVPTTAALPGGTVAPSPTGGGSSSGGTSAGGSSAGGAAPTTSTAAPVAGDRTGISDQVIKLGFHAPVTGAAPVPQESFRRAVMIYWNWINANGGVFGRKVEVTFKDDQFNPSSAVQACRALVEQDKVFILLGSAGADQITACAKYANSVGVPYLSPGVNESDLSSLPGYFAISETYRQQSPMLGQLAKKLSKAGKVAIVIEDTPTFQDSHASIVAAFRSQGLSIVYDKPISKDASQAEILTTSSALRGSGADVVYFLGPPVTFIPLAQQGQGQAYTPAYIGPGLSNGLNLVAQAGCPGIGNSRFLSPFPEMDAIDRLDPNYTKQYRAQTGQEPDDLGIAIWGVSKTIHQMLLAAGPNLTRQSFEKTLVSGKAFASNVYPALRYTAANHFGAASAHLLQADCGHQRFITAATFASSL